MALMQLAKRSLEKASAMSEGKDKGIMKALKHVTLSLQ